MFNKQERYRKYGGHLETCTRLILKGVFTQTVTFNTFICFLPIIDQVKNSYYIGLDGSLRLVLANGMEVSLYTEPHLLSGTVNPTISKRNVTLPIDNGLNLVEWRQRKEQARGQVTVYGRRLRVRWCFINNFNLWLATRDITDGRSINIIRSSCVYYADTVLCIAVTPLAHLSVEVLF